MSYKDRTQEAFSDEVEDDENLVERDQVTSWRPIINNKGLRISGALLASIFILLLLARGMLQDSHEEHYDCGHSPEEARAKDCQFDLLAFAWVPKQCFDADLASSWDTSSISSTTTSTPIK
jgi:hypothetical protein